MNLVKGAMPYFLLPFLISVLLVPVCKQIGFSLGIYAQENARTVHHGKIVRMGGAAIYTAFMVSLAILWKADRQLDGILAGGAIIFLGGLLDDIYDLSPKLKLAFQVCGALAALVIGNLWLDNLHILSFEIDNPLIVKMISFLWLIGVTNAINLIDGLDGLSSGICTIVTATIGLLGFFMARRDVCIIALCLCGSILGFLPYNFHPASIFVGDCGAQFMGFTIAALSLLGFKTTALITLGLPILVLFIPISDTLIAIVRRKLSGKKIMEADRGHLHHVLMLKLKLGHTRTVLILYLVTALFASASILTYFDPHKGIIMILCLLLLFDLFIEYTGMINPKWHPILSVTNRLFGWPKMEKGEDPVDSVYLEEDEEYNNSTGKTSPAGDSEQQS
ncbi:MAG: MraY family glycosyltransferase [Bulleidia sp.]|nr:MraY family glycosyltransferase [Bulleidia sp.]